MFELNDLQVLSIQSIGNTLIIICTESIYYLLYKEGKYIFLGEKPDIPEISFFPYIEYTDAYFVSEYTFQHGYNNPTRLDTEDINYYNDSLLQCILSATRKKHGNGTISYNPYSYVMPSLYMMVAEFFHRLRSWSLCHPPYNPIK